MKNEKMVNLEMLMVEGLGYTEKGWKPIKTSTLKKIGLEAIASETFFLDMETAKGYIANIKVGKEKVELLAGIKLENFVTDFVETVKTGRNAERKGSLQDTRDFIEELNLTEKFKEFLIQKYNG